MPIVSLLIEVLTRYPLEGQLWLFCTSCRHRSHGWGWEGIDWATMPSIVFTWLESTDSQGSSALLHVSFYACSFHCMAQQPPQVSKSMHTLLAPLTKADHPKLAGEALYPFSTQLIAGVCTSTCFISLLIKLCIPINDVH